MHMCDHSRLSSLATAGVICLLLSITAACRRDSEYGILVAKFDDDSQLFKAKIFLPKSEDNYRFNFELRQGDTACSLTGQLAGKEIPPPDDCEGIKGDGKIACNDDRSLRTRWVITSCLGGHGRSVGKKGRRFYFGFDRNKERALDQLAKAQREK